MRRQRFSLRTAAVLAALVPALLAAGASPADALTRAQIKCRDVAVNLARVALHKALKIRVNCVRRTAFGTFDPTIDCLADPEELGGDGTGDLFADRRLSALAFSGARAGDILVRRCTNTRNVDLDFVPSDFALDDVCPSATDDWHEVGQCLVDLGMDAALIFMDAVNLPGPGPLSGPGLLCMDAVHSQAKRTVGGLSRFRWRCFRDDDRANDGGGVYDCGATIMPPGIEEATGIDKYDKRLSELFPKLDFAVKANCDIPLEEVGYQFVAPDVTGGRFEGRITLFDVSEYLNDLLQETIHHITFGDTGTEGLFEGAQTGGFCGDGNLDAGEDCDDGNNLSCDGCDRDCTSPSCGNGAVCDAEECDDGNNASGDGCSAACVSEICGNGVTNPGYDEDCDDAGFSATCDDDCTFAICGDMLVNALAGETCDEGTGLPDNLSVNTPTCDGDCTAPGCPDGYWNPTNAAPPAPAGGEECDDGGDSLACDADCTTASCGDGYTNAVRGEQCDDANFVDTDDCPSSSTVPGSFCQNAFCGDGFVCAGMGCSSTEVCDDGNGSPGSSESATCDDDCTGVSCGDSNTNPSAGEQCDNGGLNSNSRPCTAGCQNARCGDGLTCSLAGCTTGPSGGVEQCDDADGDNNDPCRNDCGVATCGDSIVCSNAACTTGPGGTPEQCDTGGNSAGCDADCTAAGCGDGFHNPVIETCDTGGNSATCDADCTAVACQDGHVNPAAGEQCDDGNANNNDRCRNSCQTAFCGDGVVCTGGTCTSGPSGGTEACDNGGSNGNDRPCTAVCAVATCGDGLVCNHGSCTSGPGAGPEECDDGGGNSNVTPDACRTDCASPSCGDGVQDSGEFCDDGALNGTSGNCNLACTGITP